jgi:hypothetical protein
MHDKNPTKDLSEESEAWTRHYSIAAVAAEDVIVKLRSMDSHHRPCARILVRMVLLLDNFTRD